jgi:hypothetical protein
MFARRYAEQNEADHARFVAHLDDEGLLADRALLA